MLARGSFVEFRRNGSFVMMLLVHGFTGSASRTWAGFAGVLQTDPDFPADVASWGYPTSMRRRVPSVWEAAAQLQTELRVRLAGYERLVLVGHSLGGLVIRACVVTALREGRIDDCSRIAHIVTLATPNDGIELAGILGRFNRQISALKLSDSAAVELRNEWIDRVYSPTVRVGEERSKLQIPLTTVTALEDRIVSPESARSFFRDPPPETVPGDHVTMKDVGSADDTLYLIIKRIVDGVGANRTTAVAPVLTDLRYLTDGGERHVIEFVLDTTSLKAPFNVREIALGGAEVLGQSGFSPWLTRAMFEVTVTGTVALEDGSGVTLLGVARGGDDDLLYPIAGRFTHEDSSNEKSWKYALRFPAHLRCPAGERLQVRLAMQNAVRRLVDTESSGQFIGCYTSDVVFREAWVEVLGTDGSVSRVASRDNELLVFLANHADIVTPEPDEAGASPAVE